MGKVLTVKMQKNVIQLQMRSHSYQTFRHNFYSLFDKKLWISKAFDKPSTRDILIQTTLAERSYTIFLAIVKTVTNTSNFIKNPYFLKHL